MQVKVDLTNRFAVFKGFYPYEEFKKVVQYRSPGYFYSPQYRLGYWDGYRSLLRYNKIGTGLFLAVRKELEKSASVTFKITDLRTSPKFNPQNVQSLETSREYQIECVNEMLKCNSGGLILSATGSGKTHVAGLYFKCLLGAACFVVDELTLMDQAKKELESVLKEEIGIVGNSIFNPRRITVATIQTLHKHRRNPKFRQWTRTLDVVLIDEIHLAINRRNINTVRDIQPQVVFGLTATLELHKDHIRMPVYDFSGPPIFTYPLEKGVKEAFLSPGIVASLKCRQDGVDGDYQEEYDCLITDSQYRNNIIVSLIKEACNQGRSIIVIVERIRHLKTLSSLVADIPHRLVFGEKVVEDRIKAKEDFDKKKIRLLIVNKVFKKGISINSVDTIIECSALKSKNDAIQKYGRGIRLCQDKKGLIYIDISDRSRRDVERSSDKYNRFGRATSSRLNAFKSIQVKVVHLEWYGSAQEVIETAEHQLDAEIQNLEKDRSKGRKSNESQNQVGKNSKPKKSNQKVASW